ncbi:MAG TPA: O-antigen ligase family protein [Verrucomicrobiae bacterium]
MNKSAATKPFALVFGLFLGLCIWKFGNPAILDHRIFVPRTPEEFLTEAWPLHWANWLLVPLALWAGGLAAQNPQRPRLPRALLWLPLIWIGWQGLAAGYTVDRDLTQATLWQLGGCVACYYIGAWVLAGQEIRKFLCLGIFAALAFCLIRAVDQRVYEFPTNYEVLVEGEKNGWTNFPAATLEDMRQSQVVITTNGVEVANPLILEKFKKARVPGTLVYPNALAGLILLLFPLAWVAAQQGTRTMRPPIRFALFGLTLFLGGASFLWTGSKLGWLLALMVASLYLWRRPGSTRVKIGAVAVVLVVGLGVFALRFQHYFAHGATSTSARLDYWHAAVQNTGNHPLVGSGPGTFQRPYAQLKAPESEMARLTHNDYLEQFSDSGIPGGLAYTLWIGWALWFCARRVWKSTDAWHFALFAGVLAWFVQGLGEFSLYIPGLAWVTFTLLGCLIGSEINKIDKKNAGL